MSQEPHLTPANLVGSRFAASTFESIDVAIVGYCPRPSAIDRYQPQTTQDQFFIHVAPSSVELCSHDGRDFLSIHHVYGGPVSSALVEELAYYGVSVVLAYGLAGSLGRRPLRMGDPYIVERALARDGTTPHYTSSDVVESDDSLNRLVLEVTAGRDSLCPAPVQALTTDAIYREYEPDLESARLAGCDIVNCDSSHLFAASRKVGILSTECGVVSDVARGEGDQWDSTLATMLSESGSAEGVEPTLNPLELTGDIVELYVESVMPRLAGAGVPLP